MLKLKATFLELLRIVFFCLVAGDEYYSLIIFDSRVTINTFQQFLSVVVKEAYELITLTK